MAAGRCSPSLTDVRLIAVASPRGLPFRGVAAALVAVAALLCAAPQTPAVAHAELIGSEPAANASLPANPDELRLEFTEAVDPANAVVTILDETQAEVAGLGEPVVEDDGHRLRIPLPELEAGVYAVRYQVLSTVDGHVTGGSFAFQIDPTGEAAPPAVDVETSAPGADLDTALARWMALIGALALVGSALFWILSARPALAELGRRGVSRALWILLLGSGLVALAGTGLFLTLAARDLPQAGGEGWFLDLAAPFGTTPFGIAMRVALAGGLLAVLVATVRLIGGRRLDRHDLPVLVGALVAGVVTLAGFSAAGHVSSLGGPVYALSDLVHLLGVGAWLGALPAAAVLGLTGLAAAGTDGGRPTGLRDALRRHARVALVAAPVVAITGIANSPVVLGTARDLVASEYGNLVVAKALLFSVAVGIGAVNFFLVRRLSARGLSLTIGAELAVAALAVLTAAGMLTVPVAASRAPRLVTTEVPTAHLYGGTDEVSVHAVVGVPSPGTQTYQAVVGAAADASPLDDVQRVFMTFIPPPESGLSTERVQLDPAPPPGLYEIRGAHTPVVGEWGLEVTVRREGIADATVAFDLPVTTAPPPEQLPPADTGIGIPAPLGALWRLVPPTPYEWLPALALLGAAGVAWLVTPAGSDAVGARRRRALTGIRTSLVVAGVAVAVVTGSQQLVVAANAGGDDVLPTENPVPATAASIAAGARAYEATCAGCHGLDGEGGGPMAGGLDVRPADLGLHVPFHTDAELYAFITRGISGTPMPGFATELTPEDRWNLINYLRDRWPAP